jgi:hypothetical protein
MNQDYNYDKLVHFEPVVELDNKNEDVIYFATAVVNNSVHCPFMLFISKDLLYIKVNAFF